MVFERKDYDGLEHFVEDDPTMMKMTCSFFNQIVFMVPCYEYIKYMKVELFNNLQANCLLSFIKITLSTL